MLGIAGARRCRREGRRARTARRRRRVSPEIQEVLEAPSNDAPAENFLLVGSDSRERTSTQPTPTRRAIGDAEDVVSKRSDTIMVLRREKDGGAALLSLPRDLWVPIAGTDHSGKINSAYNDGPRRLAATVTEALGIPINHYVEVDFARLQVARRRHRRRRGVHDDRRPGHQHRPRLDPGCHARRSMALAYARSRYYEEWIDGDWDEAPGADLGRIERQQLFIRTTVTKLLQQVECNPVRHPTT